MSSTVSCVRCGTTIPRPTDKRARCAACGTALPLFDDDPTFKVPELKPLPPSPGRLPPLPAPVGADRFTQTEILPDQLPVPEGGYEDFRLDPTGEHGLPALAPAGDPPRPAPAAAPPAPGAVEDPPRRRVTPIAVLSAAPRPAPAPPPKATAAAGRAPDFAAARAPSRPPVALIAAAVVVVGGGLGAYALLSGPATPPAASAASANPQPKVALGDPVEPAPLVHAPAAAPPAPAAATVAGPATAATATAAPPRPAVAPPPPAAAPVQAAPAATRSLPPPVQRPQPPRAAASPEPRPVNQGLAVSSASTALAGGGAASASPAPGASATPATPAAPLAAAPAASAPPVEPPAPPKDLSRKPRLAEPGCLQQALQLPRDLDLAPGEVTTARFAVGPDGTAHDFSLVGTPSDRRLGPAVWSAIQRCRFIPGANAQGQEADVWMVLPFRFGSR